MAVDVGQALMLTLAVPAVCLLLFVLTQVETWLLQEDDDPHAGGQPAAATGDGGLEQPTPTPPGGMSQAA